ncbi:MAG: rubrerythrin family protein [Bacteroidia bacterium]|nr:rubrerythrin family protein [Bacteroidia bacterium]
MKYIPVSRYASEELLNVHLYQWLSQRVRSPKMQETLRTFAQQEKMHYDFWRQLLSGDAPLPKWRLRWHKFLIRLLGVSFILRLLEHKEHKTIQEYRRIAPSLPEDMRAHLYRLIEDEEQHEAEFLEAIQAEETGLRYLGFIILGLSDAIIEVTGVHAGFLGVSHHPLTAGIAGLIVGFAASISMASAAYLQAKQNPSVSPLQSALYTGLSYIIAVALLALPYFGFSSMGIAFWVSVGLAVLMILGFVYYSSVVFERSFREEALASVGILTATTVLSYGFGELLRYFFPQFEF